MTVRPILFSGPMVRARLAGRKTQTRRAISFPGIDNVMGFARVGFDHDKRPVYEMKDRFGKHVSRPVGNGLADPQYSPKFAVSDLLWVRETWNIWASSRDGEEWWPCASIPKEDPRIDKVRCHFAVDFPVQSPINGGDAGKGPWRPSIHMPRWASRITLKVTEVRVHRLHNNRSVRQN